MRKYSKSSIQKMLDDPYFTVRLTYNYFNGNVPYVENKPTLASYGLEDNIEQNLKQREIIIKKKYAKYLWLIYAIGYGIVSYLYWINDIKIFESRMLGALICPLFSYGYMAPVFAFIFFGNYYDKFVNNRIQNEELYQKYKNYSDRLKAYNFWIDIRKLDYWMSLDGHTFENAVAAAFRRQGYIAAVSKQGGDGGIDIVLTKGAERIAVQCKAHKKEIGPYVVRDLYGTMQHLHFTEGILVSRSGFTQGVYDFAKGKPIKLYNLNNILKMIN